MTSDEEAIVKWLENQSKAETKMLAEKGLEPSKFFALHAAGLKEILATQIRLGLHKAER